MHNKVIRTICLFRRNSLGDESQRLSSIVNILVDNGFSIQTKRVCSPLGFGELDDVSSDILLSVGTQDHQQVLDNIDKVVSGRENFNVELKDIKLGLEHTKLLFELIKRAPHKTFQFAYVFNNSTGSPYMPSASYKEDGFAIGLQPTDLAEGTSTLEEWFANLKKVYEEINNLFVEDPEYLGIDSSIAPLYESNSSLIYLVNRLFGDFNTSVTSDTFLKITNFIKSQNPKPIGLCGLMLPCLEDFELANEYEKGNFSIERNIFLSLHSGLGIDTYPIGVDESPERVLDIMKLVQGLSNKYNKPLSIRFVSDGKTKIGDKTDFKNIYLKDVVVRKL